MFENDKSKDGVSNKYLMGDVGNDWTRPLSTDDLAMILERMGHLALGVRALFESRAQKKSTKVIVDDIPGKGLNKMNITLVN